MLNHLALSFQEVIVAAARLSEVSDSSSFRESILSMLTGASRAAIQRGYAPEDVDRADRAVVALVDDLAKNSTNRAFENWADIQIQKFSRSDLGEQFFQQLDELLNRRQNTPELADLLEVHYLCLCLGFQGRYRQFKGAHSEQEKLRERRRSVFAQIRAIRGNWVGFDSGGAIPAEPVVPSRPDPWVRRLGFAAGGLFIVALVMFLLLTSRLGSGLDELQALLHVSGS